MEGGCGLSVGEGDRGAARSGRPERLGNLQDVGVPAGGVEDVDLFAVIRALDDGQEVVLPWASSEAGTPTWCTA